MALGHGTQPSRLKRGYFIQEFDRMRRVLTTLILVPALYLAPQSALAELGVGDKAPPLTIAEWVKGKPVDLGKDLGRIYMVEFWATWCPPCKASVPRLTEFQKKFAKDLTIIGVTAPDDRGNTKSAVRRFVKEKGATMDYTVAVDKGESTTKAYMTAAGVMGIPHAFLVGRKGHILWQGSPLDPELDSVLAQIVKGSYDITKAKTQAEVLRRFQQLDFPAQMGQWSVVWDGLIGILKIDPGNTEALDILMQIYINETRDVKAFRHWASSHLASHRGDPKIMRTLATAMMNNGDLATRAPDLALEAARAAYEGSGKRDALTMAVYARSVYQVGNLDRAIELQKEALSIAEEDDRKVVQGVLDYYELCKKLGAG
jgi:thiol-disulfide isomerase/thioredoxin